MIEYIYLFKNNDWYVSESKYINKKKLGKDAYDMGLSYWTNFNKVLSKKYAEELKDEPKMTEKQMISQIGGMLKQNFSSDNILIQGQEMKSKKEVN